MKSGSLRFWKVAPLMLAAALLLQAHSRDEVFPPRQLLNSSRRKLTAGPEPTKPSTRRR